MKIAQIAPLMESIPPRLYGGSERIASYLTEELVSQGHDVTLFASGQSITAAKLVPCCAQPLRMNPAVVDIIPYYMLMLDKVRRMASEFDVMHFHIDQFHFPIFHEYAGRTVTTLHGRQDLPDLKRLYEGFPDMPLVSISRAQRQPIRDANFAGTIYHGLPLNLLVPTLKPQGNYLAFLGRISPEKGVDRAIRLARTTGFPLKIAAKVDRVDEAYFRSEIEPLLNHPGIDYVGEIDDRHKSRFLGQAQALLFPINWPEPFGLAMIEAMACGTPVLAIRNGAVAEVIDEDVTGCVVDSIEEAIATLDRVLALDRGLVRQRFEERFSVARMADDYLSIYKQLLDKTNTRAVGRGTSRVTAKPNGAVKTTH
jgi:glycosyltransferase involved in cell wall biosynthesis